MEENIILMSSLRGLRRRSFLNVLGVFLKNVWENVEGIGKRFIEFRGFSLKLNVVRKVGFRI